MTRKNYDGLSGTDYFRYKDGSKTNKSGTFFFHPERIVMNANNTLRIDLKAWNSKTAYKNQDSTKEIDIGEATSIRINSSSQYIQKSKKYTGDGTTTDYSVTWSVPDTSMFRILADGALVPAADYTLTIDEVNGNSVSFTTAPASGVVIKLQRKGNIFDTFFKRGKLKADGEDIWSKTADFLLAIKSDQNDPEVELSWNQMGIDFSSKTKDTAE